jgi:hypothetical protein
MQLIFELKKSLFGIFEVFCLRQSGVRQELHWNLSGTLEATTVLRASKLSSHA